MNNESSQIVKAVKKVLPSVVSITMTKKLTFPESPYNLFSGGMPASPKKKRIKIGGGSGFIVDPSGIVLTNRHVLEDRAADYRVVLQSGEKIKPQVLARDPINDIAILKIEPPQNVKLSVVKFGDSLKIDLGQTVIAIGNALGLFKNTVSTGVVSGLSREIQAQSDITQEKTKLRGLIQTDAAINPGNSGGPLIDTQGRAIGINAAMVLGAENIGFALPINNARKALEELKEYGRIRQPFLGVRYLPVTKKLQDEFGLPVGFGALVLAEPDVFHSRGVSQAVVPGSPAAKAGIQEADIILEVANKKITFDQSILDIIQEHQIGQALPLKVLRNGREKMLKLILGEKIEGF